MALTWCIDRDEGGEPMKRKLQSLFVTIGVATATFISLTTFVSAHDWESYHWNRFGDPTQVVLTNSAYYWQEANDAWWIGVTTQF